jgi:hypothetical protein
MRRPAVPVVAVTLLLACACATQTETLRFRVSARTEPPDAVVAVRQGTRVIATATSPLVLDEPHEVIRSGRGGYKATLIAGIVVSVLGLLMATDSPEPGQLLSGMGQAMAPYVLVPGLVLTGVGAAGLANTPAEPPVTVTAVRPGYRFDDQPFEPGDEPVHLLLRGRPVEVPADGTDAWPVGRYDDAP